MNPPKKGQISGLDKIYIFSVFLNRNSLYLDPCFRTRQTGHPVDTRHGALDTTRDMMQRLHQNVSLQSRKPSVACPSFVKLSQAQAATR